MKRNIVLEHRQALDIMERATSKYSSCKRRGTCSNRTDCLECPAYIELKRSQVVLDEKSNALNELNEQIVQQNDALALRKYEEKMHIRTQKEEKKLIKAQTSQKPRITIEQAEKIAPEEGLSIIMPVPQLTRENLTVERYNAHRNNENLSDAQIAGIYNIPKGSFPKVKRTLFPIVQQPSIPRKDTKATDNESLLQQKFDKLELDYTKTKAKYQEVQESYGELKANFNHVSNELALSREMNTMRQDMIEELEKDLKESKSIEVSLVNDVVPDYKAMYEQMQDECLKMREERCHYEQIAKETELTFENYRKEIEALMEKRDEQDEQTIEAFNKQITIFRTYEKLMLERLLQELKRNEV